MACEFPVQIIREAQLPLEQRNIMRKCVRCWHCCLTTDTTIDWRRFYKDFELPIRWMLLKIENPTIHICPFLSAENGEPTCLIYTERPEMCKATFCKWMKTT